MVRHFRNVSTIRIGHWLKWNTTTFYLTFANGQYWRWKLSANSYTLSPSNRAFIMNDLWHYLFQKTDCAIRRKVGHRVIISVKKVSAIDHSKNPLKEIVKNLFDAKLVPLSSILTWSSSAIFHLVCSQCSMFSVYLNCVSRFFEWIRISNKEFVSKTRDYEWYSALVGHERLQLKLTSLNWRKWWLKIVI